MRLALVGPARPLRGGIALHTGGIAREAAGRGSEVLVVSFRRQYPAPLFPGRTQLETGDAADIGPARVVPAIDSLSVISWFRAAGTVREFAPDVVLLQRWHPFFAPPLAVIAARARPRARVVWMVHNVRPHEGRTAPWGPLLTLGFHAEDVYAVHATSEAEALRALGVRAPIHRLPMPGPPGVVHADALESRRRLDIPADAIVFLFFGYVRAYKGVDVLLEALALLPQGGPPWRAWIAGEWYVDRSAADARVSRPPLAGRVFLDDRYIPRAEIAGLFAAATAVVLPYREGTQSAVVSQSYAHRRPVVTTRVGGLPEVVRESETGFLVPPGDACALAEALEKVRRGHRFSIKAIDRASAEATFAPLVDALEHEASARHAEI